MGRYVVPGAVIALSTTFKTGNQIFATSGGMRRIFLVGIDISHTGAISGTDSQNQYDIPRIIAPSTTATVFVPGAKDPADAACAATCGIGSTSSTEPTITANSQMFNRGINQRGSFRWDGDRASALITPAVSNNGLACRALGFTGGFVGTGLQTLEFEE